MVLTCIVITHLRDPVSLTEKRAPWSVGCFPLLSVDLAPQLPDYLWTSWLFWRRSKAPDVVSRRAAWLTCIHVDKGAMWLGCGLTQKRTEDSLQTGGSLTF